MDDKKCPRCGLWNAGSAERCDCGFVFADQSVETSLETGQIELPGKGFFIRAVAYIIDAIILAVWIGALSAAGLILAMLLTHTAAGEAPTDPGSGFNCLQLLFNVLVPQTLYFVILERYLGGSFGKLILGMRVVRRDGSFCGWKAALIRGYTRLLDGIFFGAPAYMAMHLPGNQRWGDKKADTFVVSRKLSAVQEAVTLRGVGLSGALLIGLTLLTALSYLVIYYAVLTSA